MYIVTSQLKELFARSLANNFHFKTKWVLLKVLLECKYLKWHLDDIFYKHVHSTVDIPQFKLHSHTLFWYLGILHLVYSLEEEKLFNKSYWMVLYFVYWTCYSDAEAMMKAVVLTIWPGNPTWWWRFICGSNYPSGHPSSQPCGHFDRSRDYSYPISIPPTFRFFYLKESQSRLCVSTTFGFGLS